MSWEESIEQELAKASEGLKNGNAGLARVCARRAVAFAAQHWAEQHNLPGWQGDAMHQLHQIQGKPTVPLSVREAAQRLLTKVTEQTKMPMTTDPIADTHLILNYFHSTM